MLRGCAAMARKLEVEAAQSAADGPSMAKAAAGWASKKERVDGVPFLGYGSISRRTKP